MDLFRLERRQVQEALAEVCEIAIPITFRCHTFVQVDERVAPEGDGDRNLTHLRKSLLDLTPLKPEQIHAMQVESTDLEAAAQQYAATLARIAGAPPTLDLVHLGLGP